GSPTAPAVTRVTCSKSKLSEAMPFYSRSGLPMRLFGGSGRRLPNLVTVLVENRRDGTLAAEFIGEGSLPADSGGYSDMDALVSEVDREALALYCSPPSEPTVAIGF